MTRPPPRSTLFHYTMLFRSRDPGNSPLRPLSRVPNPTGQPNHRPGRREGADPSLDRKSTRLDSSHSQISYAVFCLKEKKTKTHYSSKSTTKANTISYLPMKS